LGIVQGDGHSKLRASLAPDSLEALRRRLTRFFEWEGCCEPEDCVNDVISEITAKLDAGERVPNVLALATSTARRVLKEKMSARILDQARLMLEPATAANAVTSHEDPAVQQQDQRAFDESFQALPAEAKDLLRSFYRPDPSHRLKAWKSMTGAGQVPLQDLRAKALRERERLENALQERMTR
jgi:hypothetical protein